jgi:hypothetical protein
MDGSRAGIEGESVKKTLFLVAMAIAWAAPALADETWSCSIIEEGKPQVVKFRFSKGKISMSNWQSRLMNKFSVNNDDENALRLITDTKDALVAVSDVRVNREPGTMQEVSMDTYAIDKYTGMLTITTAATSAHVSEIKGNCAR